MITHVFKAIIVAGLAVAIWTVNASNDVEALAAQSSLACMKCNTVGYGEDEQHYMMPGTEGDCETWVYEYCAICRTCLDGVTCHGDYQGGPCSGGTGHDACYSCGSPFALSEMLRAFAEGRLLFLPEPLVLAWLDTFEFDEESATLSSLNCSWVIPEELAHLAELIEGFSFAE